MWKCFAIRRKSGRFWLDFTVKSKITGEVFLLRFSKLRKWKLSIAELKRLKRHILEVRMLQKNGFVKFNGREVVLLDGYI